jgi:hypothetical protein
MVDDDQTGSPRSIDVVDVGCGGGFVAGHAEAIPLADFAAHGFAGREHGWFPRRRRPATPSTAGRSFLFQRAA